MLGTGRQMADQSMAAGAVDVLGEASFPPDVPADDMAMPVKINAAPAR